MTAHVMSEDEVKKIAGLVKLELSYGEIEKFRTTIPQTLDVIDILKELNTSKTTPTSSVAGLTNVYASDSISVTLPQNLALANAHDKANGLFATEAVFDRS